MVQHNIHLFYPYHEYCHFSVASMLASSSPEFYSQCLLPYLMRPMEYNVIIIVIEIDMKIDIMLYK